MNNSKVFAKNERNYLITILLVISFVWINIYPMMSTMTDSSYFYYGNLLNVSSGAFGEAVLYIIVSSFVSWIVVELFFMIYRFILSFKIYAFVAPSEKLKDDMRTFFIYRNLFLGLFLNICFLFPYLIEFSGFVDMIITMIVFICFASYIRKTYSEPIIGHFVFNWFMTPVLIYETLVVIISFLGVL